MNHPVKKVYITQKWGVNPETYSRFGLKGHNGVDYRTFDTSGNRSDTCEVFAPHSGQIIETGWDANGYGNYIKLENGGEGSILAHLKEFKKSVGDGVNEGDLIAIADNTGFSTGSHLHWGYYPKPRNRDNGYSGTVDQLLILNGNTPEVEQPTCVITDQTTIPQINDWEVQKIRSELIAYEVLKIEHENLENTLEVCENKKIEDVDALNLILLAVKKLLGK